MASVTVNGVTYSGNSVSIINGRIIIDGTNVTVGDEKIINISIQGDVQNLEVDHAAHINVNGNVDRLQTTSGDVKVDRDITGGVKTTSGDVQAYGNITGDVNSVSGDVSARQIGGSVRTVSGDINRK